MNRRGWLMLSTFFAYGEESTLFERVLDEHRESFRNCKAVSKTFITYI